MTERTNATGCEAAREAMSALLDGEEAALAPQDLAAHLVRCADCRAWYARAAEIQRRTRLSVAPEVPDLAAAVLARVAEEQPAGRPRARAHKVGLLRVTLALVALAQLWFSLPELLGHDADVGTHPAHELGSFQTALGCGLLYVAWRPWGARGLRPLVGTLALLLAATAVLDLLHGRTTVADELPHVLSLGGFLALTALSSPRLTGAPGGPTDPAAGSPPGSPPAEPFDDAGPAPVLSSPTHGQRRRDRPAGARRTA